jgi:hypothetical protein
MTKQVTGPSRYDLLREANGFVAETLQHLEVFNATTAGTIVSGTMYAGQIYLMEGDVLTNASVHSGSTVVAAQTSGFIGLYNQTGNLLAATADTGASWSTVGMHTHPFLAAYTVPRGGSGIYYAAMLMVFATQPVLMASTVPNAVRVGVAGGLAGKPLQMFNQAGLAALPNPATTPYANTGNPGFVWIGLS